VNDNNLTSNVLLGQQPGEETLDLASIPGVREHFERSDEFPILVFRTARAIKVVVNPCPGIWRMVSPSDGRCVIAGRNTFPTVLEVQAGGELRIVPIMSAVLPSGPRLQVPAHLTNDIGEVEGTEEILSVADDDDLDSIDTLDDADLDTDALSQDGPDDADMDAAIDEKPDTDSDLDDGPPPTAPRSSRSVEPLRAGWFTVAHAGGAA